MARGVTITLPTDTTLMDACTHVQGTHFYGYETETVYFEKGKKGLKLIREEKEQA